MLIHCYNNNIGGLISFGHYFSGCNKTFSLRLLSLFSSELLLLNSVYDQIVEDRCHEFFLDEILIFF